MKQPTVIAYRFERRGLTVWVAHVGVDSPVIGHCIAATLPPIRALTLNGATRRARRRVASSLLGGAIPTGAREIIVRADCVASAP